MNWWFENEPDYGVRQRWVCAQAGRCGGGH